MTKYRVDFYEWIKRWADVAEHVQSLTRDISRDDLRLATDRLLGLEHFNFLLEYLHLSHAQEAAPPEREMMQQLVQRKLTKRSYFGNQENAGNYSLESHGAVKENHSQRTKRLQARI